MAEAEISVGRYDDSMHHKITSTYNVELHVSFIVSELSDSWCLLLKGQILTLVEYALLLYRALLPTPVWYRFFLNKHYGTLFSSLTTGLYLTFKLTTVVEKVSFHPSVVSIVYLLHLVSLE